LIPERPPKPEPPVLAAVVAAVGGLFALLLQLTNVALQAVVGKQSPFAGFDFFIPVLFLAIAFAIVLAIVILVLLPRLVDWWATIIASLLSSIFVASVVYFGSIGMILLSNGVILNTPAEAAVRFSGLLVDPFIIIATFLAREVSIWGCWVTANSLARRWSPRSRTKSKTARVRLGPHPGGAQSPITMRSNGMTFSLFSAVVVATIFGGVVAVGFAPLATQLGSSLACPQPRIDEVSVGRVGANYSSNLPAPRLVSAAFDSKCALTLNLADPGPGRSNLITWDLGANKVTKISNNRFVLNARSLADECVVFDTKAFDIRWMKSERALRFCFPA